VNVIYLGTVQEMKVTNNRIKLHSSLLRQRRDAVLRLLAETTDDVTTVCRCVDSGATGWTTVVRFQAGAGNCQFAVASRPGLGPTQADQ
jgi:hypothetical protein